MKACPYCAEEIQEEALKCKHCGEWLESTEVDSSSQLEPSEVVFSPKLLPCELCNKTISATAVFCPQCGKSLVETPRVAALIKDAGKSIAATSLVTILFGAVGLAAGAAGALTAGIVQPFIRASADRHAMKMAKKHGAIDIIQQWHKDLAPSILVTDTDFIFLDAQHGVIALKCPRGNLLGASIYKERPGTKKNIVLVDYIHPKRKKKKSIKLDFYGENSYKQAEFGIAKFEEYMLKRGIDLDEPE